MNKPVKKIDAQLLEYLKALQQPTPVINALPANPAWNNHPKLNVMQQKFYQEQQHIMRTEWQLMQEKRLEEERQLTQSHHSGGGGGPPKKQTVPGAPVLISIGTGVNELSAFFASPVNNGGATITNYKYSINKGASFTVRSPAATSSPIKIAGLTGGTQYEVRIRAVNSQGDGTVSNALSGTPASSGIVTADAASLNITSSIGIGDAAGLYVRRAGNFSQSLCAGGAGVHDNDYVASRYYYEGPVVYGDFDCTKYFLMGPNTRGEVYGYSPSGPVAPQGVWKLYGSYQSTESAYTDWSLVASSAGSDVNMIPTAGWSAGLIVTVA